MILDPFVDLNSLKKLQAREVTFEQRPLNNRSPEFRIPHSDALTLSRGETAYNEPDHCMVHVLPIYCLTCRGYRKDGGGGQLYGKFSLIDLAGS